MEKEVFTEDLKVVEGAVPADLSGAFLRTGPNPQHKPWGGYHWCVLAAPRVLFFSCPSVGLFVRCTVVECGLLCRTGGTRWWVHISHIPGRWWTGRSIVFGCTRYVGVFGARHVRFGALAPEIWAASAPRISGRARGTASVQV